MDYNIKILLFFLFLLVLHTLNNTCEDFVSGRITAEYTINLLDTEKSSNVIMENKNTNNYNSREINGRSNFQIQSNLPIAKKRSEMKKLYQDNVMNFTEDEKQSITNSINYLFSAFKDKVPLIRTWNIIKLDHNIDWGFPFTISNYIVLPSQTITSNTTKLASVLFHEQLHIIQRNEKNIFNQFYIKQWEFKPFTLPDDPWINKYLIHNPDSTNFYTYKLTNQLHLLPLATSFNKQFKLSEMALFLTNKNYILAKNEQPFVEPLQNIIEYNNRFYNSKSLYHPNEIFATMLTSVMFDDLSISEIDQTSFNVIFKQLSDYF